MRGALAFLVFAAVVLPSLHAGALHAEDGRRRLALVAAASDGGGERARLRYAVADAELMAAALRDVGETRGEDLTLLLDVSVVELDEALEKLAQDVAAARAERGHIEVVFYYSGHSDSTGLLLDGSPYPWSALRARLRECGADLAIVVVDSCASGSLTREKGGTRVELSLGPAVTGLAILTSSSASEVAQESARLGGSYFTHALVSAMRGGGDQNDDGIVTIEEAYQYAYHATLLSTEATRGGAQHAAHELELRGTGAFPFSDLRPRNSLLIVDADVVGRVAVYDDAGHHVAEIDKGDEARAVNLALSPGSYRVFVDSPQGLGAGDVSLTPGTPVHLTALSLQSVQAEETWLRGVPPTLSPRGRRLAEEEYVARAIRWRGVFGTSAVQGAEDKPLQGTSLYRVANRSDLVTEMEKREAFRAVLGTTAGITGGVGAAACLGGWGTLLLSVVGAVDKQTGNDGFYCAAVGGTCVIGLASALGIGAMLCDPDPLSQEERHVVVEQYNAELRRELGLGRGTMAH